MVGMWLGLHAPERVDRLVLCCTSAHLPPASAWAERAATVREAGSAAPIADAVLGRWLTPSGAASHPELVERLRRMLLATPAEGYAACCGVIERLDLRDALPSIQAPTLAIAGAQDPATPPEHLEAIAGAVPDARLEVLDGAAHLANLERPEAVTQLILEHCGGRAYA
jgi:pimeloyl-ACP methyl ester carboxylesterase